MMDAARNLRCEVCAMVQPPRDVPQVAISKPSAFNVRVSGDTFFTWDAAGKKYAVVHFLDGLTDYHVADCAIHADSSFAASVLRDQWYGIFGPPDVLLTDAGTEFSGAIDVLNELFGVMHDTIPEGAKWRLGQAERHGAILKLMIMKMVKEMNITGKEDMRMAASAACAAKNRLCNHGGVSPLQAVTGRNAILPASLMTQICSGRMRFVINNDVDKEESLRRAERIRMAAVESFHWIDAHTTLRRALAAKSRPPRLEMLREGATVYIYDPPANRRGLARRMQDNISWQGPGTVVCVERDRNVPNRIWVRMKGRVKSVPLEKLRLATVEETVSGHFIKEALEDVQKELTSGRMKVDRIERDPDGEKAEMSDDDEHILPTTPEEMSEAEPAEEEKDTYKMQVEKRLLQDVPLGFRAPQVGGDPAQGSEEPSALPFPKKQRLFERLAEELEAPTSLQHARVRGELEDAYEKIKAVRKKLKTVQPKPKPQASSVQHRRESQEKKKASAFINKQLKKNATDMEKFIDFEQGLQEDEKLESEDSSFEVDEEAMKWRAVMADMESGEAEYGVHVTTVLQHYALWSSPSNQAQVDQMVSHGELKLQDDAQMLDQTNLVTGKMRLEYQWNQLDEEWKRAYVEPIKKAYKVYLDHDAVEGVTEGQWVEPRRILPSRLVLTNKGEKDLAGAELKARWIFGGHRDPDAGQYLTSSPTVSLIGHNLLNAIAVQKKWAICYEDVSAAFLQGQKLPAEREIYVRVPKGYPPEALEYLVGSLGKNMRTDLVKLTKGGFGLPESPRLWYLEYKRTLLSLGAREMKLLPGFFVFYDVHGKLEALACIHVDDTRYAGAPTADRIWKALHERLDFGKKRVATEGWSKFCGRYEKQDPQTYELYYSMDSYCKEIPMVKEREKEDMSRPLTDAERKMIASVVGQVAWAARQCRYDLSYGCSYVQQLVGEAIPQALTILNKVVRRSKQSVMMKVPQLGCGLEEVVFLSMSDAAYGAQPRGGSQGGIMVAMAHPDIQVGSAPVAVLEGMSAKLQRVVRCSMSAELSVAATAYEHGDYVRAVFAEMTCSSFMLSSWKMTASYWKHILVFDAKVAYDALQSESSPTDRKLIVDIAILREALEDPQGHSYVRWVPGREIPCDSLTKWYGNDALLRLLQEGKWSLMDTELAQELRERVAARKRLLKSQASTKGVLC